jgi:hypothetical protein
MVKKKNPRGGDDDVVLKIHFHFSFVVVVVVVFTKKPSCKTFGNFVI